MYNNSSTATAFTLKLDILFLFLFPFPFLLRFIYLPFFILGAGSQMYVSVGGKIEIVTSSNGWNLEVCDFNIHCDAAT